MRKAQFSALWFVAGLIIAVVLGFLLGASLERPSDSRQVLKIGIELNPEFVLSEEGRGVAHRDVIDSYLRATEYFASGLLENLEVTGFSREIVSEAGLPRYVMLYGVADKPPIREMSIDDLSNSAEMLASLYQFRPINVLEISSETENLPPSVAGWQMGAIFSVITGLLYSITILVFRAIGAASRFAS